MAPYDIFVQTPRHKDWYVDHYDKGEVWFILILEPEDPVKSIPIWVKFYFAADEYNHLPDNFVAYYNRKRTGIMAQLEREIILNIEDPDVFQTALSGTPHLYRLVTKNTKIEDLRKEDKIF